VQALAATTPALGDLHKHSYAGARDFSK